MSAISRPAHGKREKTAEYLGAARSLGFRLEGTSRPNGYLYCTGCGGPAMAKADFAAIAGVSVGSVTKFLNRGNLRPDIAQRIRRHLAEVDE
jgi:hypothetical protein